MKKSDLTSLLTVATLFLVAGGSYVIAQPAPGPDGESPVPRQRQQFDLNKDGKIDDTERAAAEAQMRAKLSENPKFLTRADNDKDGKVSDAEWAVAKEKFKHHHHERMEKMRQHPGKDRPAMGPQARGQKEDPAFRHGYLLGKYDANNDGQLDDTERAAVRAGMEAKMRANMEKQLARLKAVDTDNDGKISDAEWAVAKEKFKEMHPPMDPHGPGMMPHPLPE